MEAVMKLNVKSFSLTCGIFLGVGFMIATWWLVFKETPGEIMIKFDNFFFGYTFTYIGGLVGLVWGFVYGSILGAIFSWLHNLLAGNKKSEQ